MISYTHLTMREREIIFLYHGFGFTVRKIGQLIKRHPSTIMRELKRKSTKFKAYSPYEETICKLLFEDQRSTEQIANRIRREDNESTISFNTIYRSIYNGLFEQDFPEGSPGA